MPRPCRDAARRFNGLHDFRSFTDDDPDEKSTQVMVERSRSARAARCILIRVVGSHFLWKMVRRMVGVLAEVGRGALDESDVVHFLSGPSEAVAPLTAPPSGLFLERVL